MNKNILYYIIVFFIYTFLGSHIEHLSYFMSNKNKSMENPIITGFPLYGACSLSIIAINNYLNINNVILEIIIFGGLITIIELLLGLVIGAGKDGYTENGLIKTWDYSDNYFNYRGIISLRHYLMWGVLASCVIRMHPYISQFVTKGLS